MAGRERVVSFTIQARDKYSAEFKAFQGAMDRLRKARENTASQRKTTEETQELRRQIEAVSEAYEKARIEAQRLSGAAKYNLAPSSSASLRALQRGFQEAAAETTRLRDEQRALNAELNKMRGSGAGFAGLSSQWTATSNALEEQARRAREAAAAQRELEASQRAAAAAAAEAARETAAAARASASSALVPRSGGLASVATAGSIGADRQKLVEMQVETQRLVARYDELRLKTGEMGRALAQAEAPTAQMTKEFTRARTEVTELRDEIERSTTAIAKLKAQASGVGGGFTALTGGMGRAAIDLIEIRQYANARAEAEEEDKMRSALASARGGGWWSNLVDSIVDSGSTAHERGPLGLRPYELTNLSYQINDLITQVASGTPVMQAFAQQGGQIAQIFPTATASLLKMAPAVGALGVAVGTVVSAIGRIKESEAIMRSFSAQMAATVNPEAYDPARLKEMVRELQSIGVAVADSRAAISTMIADETPISRMQRLLEVSRDFAIVSGQEFPDAFAEIRKGFDGTFKSLEELDAKYNFLTAAQRNNIRAMYESGDAYRGAEEALSIFASLQDEAAEKASGEWSEAMLNLGNAWRNFLDWIGTTAPIQWAIGAINVLSGVVNNLSARLDGLSNVADGVIRKVMRATTLGRLISDATGIGAPPPPAPGPAIEEDRDSRAGARLSERQQKIREDASRKAREETFKNLARDGELIAEANRKIDETIAEEKMDRLVNNLEAEGKMLEEAQKERLKIAEAIDKLEADNAQRTFEASIALKSDLEQKQLTAVREAEQELSAVGLSLDEDRRNSILETTKLLHEQEVAAKAAADAEREKTKKGRGGGAAAAERKAEIAERKAEIADRKELRLMEEGLQLQLRRRKQLMDLIKAAEAEGDNSRVATLQEQFVRTNAEIEKAIANIRGFWAESKRAGTEGAQNAELELQIVEQGLKDIETQSVVTAEEINMGLARGGAEGIGAIAEALANGENAFKSFGETMREVFANLVISITEAIAQQLILNALGAGPDGGGGFGAKAASLITSAFFHGGGIAGEGGHRTRSFPAAVFAAAPRYHSGSNGVGLRSNEVPAVLERGEAVLTKDDPNHPNNAGKAVNVKVVNTIDPTEILESALSSPAGEKVIMNFFSRRQRGIKGVLG